VVVARAAAGAVENVREGLEMAPPLAASGVFPPMVTRMVAVGEETGTTDQLLEKVAQFYDREVNAGVARLSSLLEPVLLIFMGVVIGSIIISVMLPMLTVMSAPIGEGF
jgi:type IV pilus assembly protein PilC